MIYSPVSPGLVSWSDHMGIADRLFGWLRQQKDASTSFILERLIERTIWRYGRMVDFKIDSKQKTARIEVLLKGENEPIVITVQRYELAQDPSNMTVAVAEATASREWVTVLIDEFVRGKRFVVPEKYAKLLRLVA